MSRFNGVATRYLRISFAAGQVVVAAEDGAERPNRTRNVPRCRLPARRRAGL